MKKLGLVFLLMISTHFLMAEINFNSKEYKPKGKHYNSKENKLYYSKYVSVDADLITLLYFKTPNNVIIFKGFWISKSLEEKLPMVVVKFIGKYITDVKLKETHSIQDALNVTKKAIINALDQKWKNNLVSNASTMVNNLRYHRGNSAIDNNKYYEFIPNHLDAPDSTKQDYIEKPKTWASGFQSGDIKKNLDAIITVLNAHKGHHKDKVVSDWPWSYNENLKKWELKSDTVNYHIKDIDTCKLKLKLLSINKGQLMPNMCWRQINGASWTAPPTYCNFFAQALAVRTFAKSGYDPQVDPKTDTDWYPWENEKRANEIHDYMVSHPELFVDLEWKDCWKYVNAGYIVYFIWKNPVGAGHIATGYPTDGNLSEINGNKVGKIVQAGTKGKTLIFPLTNSNPWDSKVLTKVKTYLYLGYLTF